MIGILQGILDWFWALLNGAQSLAEWLFLPLNDNPSAIAQALAALFAFIGLENIAPIGLVGIGAGIGGAIVLTIGIIRAIA